jgi:hypothetical protein
MIEQQPIAGKVIRVYDPPKPLEDPAGRVDEVGGVAYGFRDFPAQKVDIAPDGTMTLTQIEATGEELDIKTGRKMQGYRQTLLAVIDADGHLRAESIDLAREAGSALD